MKLYIDIASFINKHQLFAVPFKGHMEIPETSSILFIVTWAYVSPYSLL